MVHPILPSPVSIFIFFNNSGLSFCMFSIDFFTSSGTCSTPQTFPSGGMIKAIAAVRQPVPLPTSRAVLAVTSLLQRSSNAQACMWGADMVAPYPMGWGESSQGGQGEQCFLSIFSMILATSGFLMTPEKIKLQTSSFCDLFIMVNNTLQSFFLVLVSTILRCLNDEILILVPTFSLIIISYYPMKRHYFLLQKFLLFLFYIQSLVIMQDDHKHYFWLISGIVAIISFSFEGARPYTPIFIVIFIADILELSTLQTGCVVILGLLMAYFKFYHIEIVGKGPYNAGYRFINKEDLEIGVFYPSMSDGAHCKWIPTQKYNQPLYEIFFVDPTQLKFLPFRIFKFIVSFLFKIKMPVLGNATLYTDDSDPDEKWKVVIFSHGLGSNMTNFSAICGWWASHGYIVVSVQHNHDRIRIQFGKEMVDQPDSLEKMLYNKRNEDLLVRAAQMQKVIDMVIGQEFFSEVFSQQRKKIQIEEMFLAGHSYGGSTVLQTAANLILKEKTTPMIKGLICLDAWYFPLSSSTYQALKNQNMLFLNSQTFFKTVPYIYYMQEKMGRLRQPNRETLKAFVIKKTDHISTSDFAFTFGNMMKLLKAINLQEYTIPILEFHQIVISLFMQNKNTKEILQISNHQATINGLMEVGVYLVEEWRYEREEKKQ